MFHNLTFILNKTIIKKAKSSIFWIHQALNKIWVLDCFANLILLKFE